MLVLGGEGTLVGSLFGSLVLTLLPTLIQDLAMFKTAAEGALLVATFLFMPEGLYGRLALWLSGAPVRAQPLKEVEARQ